MASTLRTTASLTYGPMGETACTNEPTRTSRSLPQGNVILELDALTDSDKIFLVETILLSIDHQRLFAEGDREQLKHVILVEEAHHVFLRSKQEMMEESRSPTSSSARSGSWVRRWCSSTSTPRRWRSPPSVTPTARSA